LRPASAQRVRHHGVRPPLPERMPHTNDEFCFAGFCAVHQVKLSLMSVVPGPTLRSRVRRGGLRMTHSILLTSLIYGSGFYRLEAEWYRLSGGIPSYGFRWWQSIPVGGEVFPFRILLFDESHLS